MKTKVGFVSEVCVKCWVNYFKQTNTKGECSDTIERYLSRGKMWCMEQMGELIPIKNGVPDYCPYLLEHIMLGKT